MLWETIFPRPHSQPDVPQCLFGRPSTLNGESYAAQVDDHQLRPSLSSLLMPQAMGRNNSPGVLERKGRRVNEKRQAEAIKFVDL
jgi:hypothetical protein